jgi:predicted CDP-diglyceride synthetase/phosphatidate cytidylyltransferase
MSFKEEIFYIMLPLIVSNSLHMYIVKKDYFSFLNIPISVNKLGQNKTLRGFIIVPIITSITSLIHLFLTNNLNMDLVILSYLFGLIYMIAELPNSFLKRKLNISSGGQASKNQWFFTLLDKTDSALGVAILYHFTLSANIKNSLLLFVTGSLIHITFSLFLVRIKVKKSF